MASVALDQQLGAEEVGSGRSSDAAVAYVLWVGGEHATLPEGDPSGCRPHQRPGWRRKEGGTPTPEVVLQLEESTRQLQALGAFSASPGRRVCCCHTVWLPINYG